MTVGSRLRDEHHPYLFDSRMWALKPRSPLDEREAHSLPFGPEATEPEQFYLTDSATDVIWRGTGLSLGIPPLGIGAPSSHVPHESPRQARAAYLPVTVQPVNRLLLDLIPGCQMGRFR